MSRSWPRPRWVLAGVLIATLAASVLFSGHVLRGAGALLTEDDSLTRVDAVALLSGSDAATVLETSDLAMSFSNAAIVLLASDDAEIEAEFARRGAESPSESRRVRDQLTRLGVAPSRIWIEPVSEGGTRGELAALAAWTERQRVSHLAVVVAWHHSARAKRVARRTFGEGVQVAVRMPRLHRARRHDWWLSRDGRRAGLIELQKLMLDWLRHPLG